jgi:hypothetical protein
LNEGAGPDERVLPHELLDLLGELRGQSASGAH